MERPAQNGTIERLSSAFFDWSLVYQLAILILIAGVLFKWSSRPRKQNTFPPWAVIEIAVTSLIVSRGGLLQCVYSLIRRYGGSLFGLTSKHQVIVNLSEVDRFMSQSYHTLNAEPVQYTLFTRVFGAEDSAQLKFKLETSWKDLLKPIEDMFLNDSAASGALQRGGILEKANAFVSFSSDAKEMKRWELSAGIRVIKLKSSETLGAVEANLQSLARDFGACIAIPLLYGTDFLDRYPQLLDDFWKFDNDVFPLLMIGIPPWAPFRIMKNGVAARSRLLEQMDALYRRIDQHQKGVSVDFDADMSDISNTALERNRVYDRKGWSFRERGGGDLAILWGQNANTQAIFFWLLTFAYSTPGVIDQLREETAPFFKLSQEVPRQIISMDLPALFGNCPRMKSCIYETYRLANEATSIRYVARPITINDGEDKHQLNPGMFVSAPHSVIQRDASVYANPDTFVPDRFLNTDPESGRVYARYGKLRPWGSGAAMCKGRSFAEKEIIALAASIVTIWDIQPAGGTWKLPSMIPGTGVKKPVEDIRVIISPRNSG